ncbi:MAG: hypothetical protein OXL41_02430 [Nitrospinae bacterium]|nr:hypothetical protein [Nitrospinota bacterium]
MELPDWIGQFLLAGGGGAAIAFGLFRFWGQNWIKLQLDKDLETAKSEISIHAAKRLRLQDKEYEVFPEIWARLSDSRASLESALVQFRAMPDLDRMSDDDFEKWLEGTDLTDEEKQIMNSSTDRLSLYNKYLDYKALRKAQENYLEFQTYFEKNRIFLRPEIRMKFDKIGGLLKECWTAKKVDVDQTDQTNWGGQVDYLTKAFKVYTDEVKPLMGELEEMIQGSLFPENEGAKR